MDTYHGCSLSTPLSSATPARCSFTGVRGREFLRTSGVGVVESSPPKTKNDAGERRPPTIAYTEVGRPVSSLRGATSRGAWSEYHAACLARPLGLVARLVRRPEQLLGSLLGSDGDADARRGVHHMPLLAGFEGHAQPSWKRSATLCALLASVTSSSRTANSSPPIRAARSEPRKDSLKRSATARSTLSPSWWPKESFTSLKSSRSTNITATLEARRLARERALERCS